MMKKFHSFTWVLFIIIFVILLILKLHLTLNRQFDPDEFAYLHWAYLLSHGQLPYKDFFFYVTPLFPGFLSPLFLLPPSPTIIVIARFIMFGISLATLLVLFYLVGIWTKNIKLAFLTVLIFLAFPMTFDKTIEVRPDMLMILFFLIGVANILRAMGEKNYFGFIDCNTWATKILKIPSSDQKTRVRGERKKFFWLHFLFRRLPMEKKEFGTEDEKHFLCEQKRAGGSAEPAIQLFLSGFFFSLSFLTMYKIIFAAPAIIFLLFNQKALKPSRVIFWTTIGALAPVSILLIYLLRNNLFSLFINATTSDARVANIGSISFPPWMTLSPWPLIYVQEAGVSIPWILNSVLWVLMIPGVIIACKRYRTMGVFLSTLLMSSILFLILFPRPYVQYFIVPSIIASIGSAVVIITLSKKHIVITALVTSFFLLLSFSIQTMDRQTPLGSNQEQLMVIKNVLSVIQPDESVYDMVGSYVFRPDGYYICCHPYVYFVDRLNRPISTLSKSLKERKTKFLVMDQKGYVFWIAKPEDLAFMIGHYLPSAYAKIYTLGSSFQCEQGSCIQLNVHGQPISQIPINSFEIIVGEMYRISITPHDQNVVTENRSLSHDQTVHMNPGTHSFSVPPTVSSFTVQLDR